MRSILTTAEIKRAATAERLFPKEAGVYFDAKGIAIDNRYVAWIDLLGAQSIMGRSLTHASNFIGRIHAAVLAAAPSEVTAYPVIDGSYIVAEERDPLEKTLRAAMNKLATTFVHEEKMERRFLVRGGIAAGRLVAGSELTKGNKILKANSDYAGCVAIGTAVGQAFRAEKFAPPYGFWVDITARAFKNEDKHPFTNTLWRWWEGTGTGMTGEHGKFLGKEVCAYLFWAKNNHFALEYPLDSIASHESLTREYFRLHPSASAT